MDRREFKNEREEWVKFVEGIPGDSKVAIEACSYWYPVCVFLEDRGIEMVLSHPSKTRIIAEGKIKTDKIDSKNLAKLLRADFLPQSYIPSKGIIEVVEKYGEDFFIGGASNFTGAIPSPQPLFSSL